MAGGQRTRDRWAYSRQGDTNELLGQILTELRVLRELALVAVRYPDLSEVERERVLNKVKDWLKEES
jgi:hypothetical protein